MPYINKIYSLLFLFLSVSTHSLAQTDNINTDRPDQSDGVFTVPKNKFQIEEGITTGNQIFLNNLMVRYGLTQSTEFRLLADAGKEWNNRGLKPLTFSLKQRIISQNKILPAITFAGYFSWGKLAGKDFSSPETPWEIKLAFENEISEKVSLGYNIGTSENFEALNLTFGVGYSVSNKVSAFAEYFSTVRREGTQHNMDVGILYAVIPSLQLDVAYGRALTHSTDPYYVTFGISYRFY